MILGIVNMAAMSPQAETVYYILDNVMLAGGTQMTGLFSWTYNANDFESGVGQFTSLNIPWTSHDESDLHANIDVTESIEITLTNNLHDDGVDIMLVLSQPLTPTTGSTLVIGAGESKYEIGGNGFHTGLFLSGSISPTNSTLRIEATPPGHVTLSWESGIPGYVLQEATSLTATNWMDSTNGSANPVVIQTSEPMKFYRLAKPIP